MSSIQARFQLDRPDFTLDVELSLPGRGITALFGPSGSGKTTLLRCIAGLEPRARGFLQINEIIWQDRLHNLPTHRRPLGYVFQEASLFEHLDVLGNLRYGLKRSGQQRSDSLERAIDLLGIKHLLQRSSDSLSGGEKQRVSIARALAVNPGILLLDEPLAALDHRRKQEILPYLERLHRELDIPVIYVSHAAEEVARLADHLVLMEQGKAMAQGPLAETLARLDLPVQLGEDTGVVLEAVVSQIDSQWHLTRVDFNGGSLWTQHHRLTTGQPLRIRILARDVSLALEKPLQSSIQNILQGNIDEIADDVQAGQALVRIRLGDTRVLARLTRRAIAELKLQPDQPVWVQVKAVALLE